MDKPTNVLLIEDSSGDLRLIREMLSETKGSSFELVHTGRLSSGLERLMEGASMQSYWTSDYRTVRDVRHKTRIAQGYPDLLDEEP